MFGFDFEEQGYWKLKGQFMSEFQLQCIFTNIKMMHCEKGKVANVCPFHYHNALYLITSSKCGDQLYFIFIGSLKDLSQFQRKSAHAPQKELPKRKL